MSLVAIPVNITHIVFFSMGTSADAVEATWRSGIITSHGILATIMCIMGIASYKLKLKPQSHAIRIAIPYIASTAILTMAVVIVMFDQLVTASITPFMVGCLITALVLLLAPRISSILFVLAFLGYFFAIPYTQTDPAIVLSNRVNGITMIGLGLFLSILLWRTTTNDLINKRTIAQQQKELEQKTDMLELLAFFDQLTGIYNRHKLEELLKREYAASQEKHQPFSLIMVDIDHFKPFNDAYGHLAGDQVLVRVAKSLDTIAQRAGALMGRFGGEEFLILLGNTTMEAASVIAEQMRSDIEGMCIENRKVGTCLTISLGISTTTPTSSVDSEALVHAADMAMYEAKELGRNRIVIHSPSV
jgi:diguanylate cyclase (GGDEF)-like protein